MNGSHTWLLWMDLYMTSATKQAREHAKLRNAQAMLTVFVTITVTVTPTSKGEVLELRQLAQLLRHLLQKVPMHPQALKGGQAKQLDRQLSQQISCQHKLPKVCQL
jgi:hypothetical protein